MMILQTNSGNKMTCYIIKQRNLYSRDAIGVEEKGGQWDFWAAFWYTVVYLKKKKSSSLEALTAEMMLDCSSLNEKGIFLICSVMQVR